MLHFLWNLIYDWAILKTFYSEVTRFHRNVLLTFSVQNTFQWQNVFCSKVLCSIKILKLYHSKALCTFKFAPSFSAQVNLCIRPIKNELFSSLVISFFTSGIKWTAAGRSTKRRSMTCFYRLNSHLHIIREDFEPQITMFFRLEMLWCEKHFAIIHKWGWGEKKHCQRLLIFLHWILGQILLIQSTNKMSHIVLGNNNGKKNFALSCQCERPLNL